MKQRSQSVQASTTLAKSSLFTSCTSPLADWSTRSNSRGKLSQRLKQRRQPWQMSKTRRISASSFSGSAKSGSFHARGWRVGASRLPSLMDRIRVRRATTATPSARARTEGVALRRRLPRRAQVGRGSGLSAEGVQGLLETTGMRLLGLRQGLEPVGDLLEAFLTGGARHARIHVGVFVGLAGDRGLQVRCGAADGQAGRRIAHRLEELEM